MTDDRAAANMGPWLELHLAKTEAGRREITERRLTLSRSARNLLLIIDAQRSAGQWLALVQGCGPAELQQLVGAGLVGRLAAPASAPADPPDAETGMPVLSTPAAAPTAAPAAASTTARMSLAEALQAQGYRLLYDRLTAEARPQLGLIKGYKMILNIERCAGPVEIRLLALQFVEQVRGLKGDAEANALAQRLANPA